MLLEGRAKGKRQLGKQRNRWMDNIKTYVRFEVFTAWAMKNCVFGMLRRVALVRTNISEELSASIIRVTRIGEL
jgi:hypothetical protein